ncbi:hypothetical protein ABT336_24130 [Micromonospora sp. NPDC000207]|uniref:hypothetical protein n=1 Tax=Micromonospora sp. NPDC000207 TaxID=3154246 RepID=UPI00332A76C7
MRFARSIAGLLLLLVGVLTVTAGGLLGLVARHADDGTAFTTRFEPVRTTGHAVVVEDLTELVDADLPFARTGGGRIRLDADTGGTPAFVGLAPTEEIRRWAAGVPHATVRRVALSRGPLPVRLDPAAASPRTAGPVVSPRQVPWVRQGVGTLEWRPQDLTGQRLGLVVMRTDGRPGLALDLRGRWTLGWLPALTAGLLAGGTLLAAAGLAVLLRRARPREVVFVVEPDQVPVLAGRLGVTSLSGLGARPTRPDEREPVGVGARPLFGSEPGSPGGDLGGPPRPRPTGPGPTALTWPPTGPQATPRPLTVPSRLRPAAPPER